jgi:hypothetical protein
VTDIAGCKRVVAWGGKSGDQHSHRWIFDGLTNAARKMGMHAAWFNDTAEEAELVKPGDLVFTINIWAEHLPLVQGAKYVAHNLDGTHPLFWDVRERDWIRWQVYTDSAKGEQLGSCRYWIAENRTLIQPWGADLFAEEFYEPVFNPHSREAVFVGAVWNTDGQGNSGTIVELKTELAKNKLRFVHRTQISQDEMLASIRAARIAPAFAGPWQVENNYLPCRVFKNSSYGQLVVTNVPRFRDLYGAASLEGGSIPTLVSEAMSLKRSEWLEMVVEQQRVTARFTYRESLQTIDRVFES